MVSRNQSCKDSIALYHELQSRKFVICIEEYVYKNIHANVFCVPEIYG